MTHESSIYSATAILSLDELNDDELVDTVEKMRKNNKVMEMENLIFENFLRKVDPKLLQGIQAILEQAGKIQGQLEQAQASMSMSQDSAKISRTRSTGSVFGSIGSSRSRMSMVSLTGDTKRINLPTRIELLSKERELYLISIEEYYQAIKIKRNNLRAELEEINTRISETQDAREIFEQSIVKDAVDPLTQRIPAEKFIRYLDEWLKCAESTIEKLRLRICTLRYKKIFLQNQLKQKEELGESLHPVDLDQLKIDHRVLNKKLEQKNIDLLDLKKKSGEANLVLSKHKRYLQSQIKILHSVNNIIKDKQEKAVALEKEIKLVEKEVNKSEEKLKNINNINEKYTVPDLVDYIKQKSEIHNLKENIKIWQRRNNIQQSAIESAIKTMKQLTQRNSEDDSWFDSPQLKTDESFNYDDDD